MAAAAADGDGKGIGIRADQARIHRNVPDRIMGVKMTGKDHFRSGKSAIADHGGSTATGLLGRLKKQYHPAGKVSITQLAGCAKEHGHMTIMTTGMHNTRDARGKVQAGFLVNGQPVHIGPQGNTGAISRSQFSPDTGSTSQAARIGYAKPVQLGHDQGRGFFLGKGQFGMGVNPAAQIPHPGKAIVIN
jgi:arylsulfatase A-like enzyme